MKRDLGTAAIGGGIGGLLDALYATLLWGVYFGMGPVKLWQSVAAGLLGGDAASAGGNGTALLGLALHFFIAFCMALAYVLASKRLPLLTTRPLLMGALYGVVLYVVMNFVVVPLSAIGWRGPPAPMSALRALIPHVIFVGPAIALATAIAWRSRATPKNASEAGASI